MYAFEYARPESLKDAASALRVGCRGCDGRRERPG